MLATCRVTVRDGLELTWVEAPPGTARLPNEPVLTLGQAEPFRVVQRRIHGSVRHDGLRPDDVIVIPASQPVRCPEAPANSGPAAYMGVTVAPRLLATTADSIGILFPERELRYRLGVPDRTLDYLIPALVREQTEPGPGGPLFTDALATQLVVHLVRTHATPRPRHDDARITAAIDFIHEHLDEQFTVADVARVIDLSPYHFSRAFKRVIGEAPHQYVLAQRLAHAHKLIAGSDLSIADVAIQAGFYDQSHFGYHFKRHFGVTPAAFRRGGHEGKDLPVP
jgi:AraC family transcriptional regulator